MSSWVYSSFVPSTKFQPWCSKIVDLIKKRVCGDDRDYDECDDNDYDIISTLRILQRGGAELAAAAWQEQHMFHFQFSS